MSLNSTDWIKTFVTFVETGNISKAADKLNLSQPAITHQLKVAEEHFPIALFAFSGRKKVLTPYGQQIYQLVKAHEEKLERQIESVNRMFLGDDSISLRIGMRNEVARRIAPYFDFKGNLIVQNMSGERALDLLQKREIDLVITERTPGRDELKSQDLFSDHTQLVVHKSVLGDRDFKSEEFLSQTPFLAYRQDVPFLREWLKHCDISIRKIKMGLVCQDWFVIFESIQKGRGWSLMPTGLDISSKDLFVYDIDPKIISPTQFHAYYFEDFLTIPAFKNFIDKLTGSLNNVKY